MGGRVKRTICLISVALWVLCLLGCELGCVGVSPPAPAPAEGVRLGEAREVKLVAPGAARYGEALEPSPLERRFLPLLVEEAGASLIYEPCLGLAATEYARHLVVGGAGEVSQPRALQEAALHHVGCPDGWASSHIFLTGDEGEEEFRAYLREVLRRGLEMTHVGLGRARAAAPYRWAWVVFLTERQVSLEPLPRAVTPGQEVQIIGRTRGDLRDPKVLLLAPGGEVEALETLQGEEGRFVAQARLGGGRGVHWVEILGTGPRGPRVASLFPIYVGEEPPGVVALAAAPDEGAIKAPAQAEALMLALVNEERAGRGLPALIWDERLAEIARGHSAAMRDGGFFAHVSPDGGALSDRFAAARYPAQHFAENLSRSATVREGVDGLMQSLGHRENILHPRFTHLGIGAVFVEERYGGRAIIMTQNFAVPQRRLSGSQFREEALGRFQEARRARDLEALESPGALQEVAAAHVGRSEDVEALSKEIRAALDARGVRYRSIFVQLQVVGDPRDLTLPREATRAHVQAVGLGARPQAQGTGGVLWSTLLILLVR